MAHRAAWSTTTIPMAHVVGVTLNLGGYCRKVRACGWLRLLTQLQKILRPGKVSPITLAIALRQSFLHSMISLGDGHEG
jgi:hypothetical protein